MPDESIENITKSDSNFASTFVDHYLLLDMNFNEHCLTKNKFASTFVDRNLLPGMNFNGHCLIKNNIYFPQKVINLYISYTWSPKLRNLNTDFILSSCVAYFDL